VKSVICSVYDKAVEAYMRPFVAQSIGQATRQFADEVNNADSPMHKHPEDYALFHVADWSDHDAKITPIEPKCLMRAHEIKARNE